MTIPFMTIDHLRKVEGTEARAGLLHVPRGSDRVALICQDLEDNFCSLEFGDGEAGKVVDFPPHAMVGFTGDWRIEVDPTSTAAVAKFDGSLNAVVLYNGELFLTGVYTPPFRDGSLQMIFSTAGRQQHPTLLGGALSFCRWRILLGNRDDPVKIYEAS